MKRALICGSFAYDTIMIFPGRFKEHILPESVHVLNVAFMVPEMRREFGGCAGNIAWSMELLSPGSALPMGTVGADFAPYSDWMDRHGISRQWVTEVASTYTAQAFITTDRDNNQITAFHPGAMSEAHRNHVGGVDGLDIAIISPDGRAGMLQHARECHAAGLPFIFDPGQGLPMFDGEELRAFIDQASWVAVNDYEWRLLSARTGYTIQDCAARVRALIITSGGNGSCIHTAQARYQIPAVTGAARVDPTGCGDAYRAGLLYGLLQGLDWETAGRVASLLGAIKVACAGTQNHRFTPGQFRQRFQREFGAQLPA